MSKNVWIATVDCYEDVLSSRMYFETREQAERYISIVQQNPEVLMPGIKINDCLSNKMICTVNPVPLHDNEFLDEFEKSIEEEQGISK